VTEPHVHPDRPPTDGSVPVSIEPLILFADDHGIHELVPDAPTRLPCRESPHPNDAAAEVARRLGLAPCFVHSTSWRIEASAVVITYVVCVAAVAHVPGTTVHRIAGAVPATGTALDPPAAIEHDHIVGHALRHLAWLTDHDPAAGMALAAWRPHLAAFRPAPFAQLQEARAADG
jgi:hypothetical protein